MAIVQGEKAPQKAQPDCSQPRPSVAGGGGDGGCGGGVAGVFLFFLVLLLTTTWILVKDGTCTSLAIKGFWYSNDTYPIRH
jgi:hypothetical protein